LLSPPPFKSITTWNLSRSQNISSVFGAFGRLCKTKLLTLTSAPKKKKEKQQIFAVLRKIIVGVGAKTTIPWLQPQNKRLANGVILIQNHARPLKNAKMPRMQNVQATPHAKTLAEKWEFPADLDKTYHLNFIIELIQWMLSTNNSILVIYFPFINIQKLKIFSG
jgi:hypothetical protein